MNDVSGEDLRRRQTERQMALDKGLAGIMGGFKTMDDRLKTERAEALEQQKRKDERRKELGKDYSPAQVEALMERESELENKAKAEKENAPNIFQRLFGATDESKPTDAKDSPGILDKLMGAKETGGEYVPLKQKLTGDRMSNEFMGPPTKNTEILKEIYAPGYKTRTQKANELDIENKVNTGIVLRDKANEASKTFDEKDSTKKYKMMLDAMAGRQATRQSFQNTESTQRQRLMEVDRFNSKNAPLLTSVKAANDVEGLLNLAKKGNPIAGEAAKNKILRLSDERGALSDQDRASLGGSKAIDDKIKQIAQTALTGSLTPDNIRYLEDIAIRLGKTSRENLEKATRRHAKSVSRILQVPEEEIYKDLVFDQSGDGSMPQTEADELEEYKRLKAKAGK